VTEPAHRFLCLLGCWFCNPDYLRFHEALEALKSRLLPHHQDDPVILHREDMLNARRDFKVLREPAMRADWDKELMKLINAAEFRIVAVVIDKRALREDYATATSMTKRLRAMATCYFRIRKNKKASCEALLRSPLRAIHLR
jgi:hypothetical protein